MFDLKPPCTGIALIQGLGFQGFGLVLGRLGLVVRVKVRVKRLVAWDFWHILSPYPRKAAFPVGDRICWVQIVVKLLLHENKPYYLTGVPIQKSCYILYN